MLFTGLLGLLVPLMFGRELGWPLWMWLAMAAGALVLAGFIRLQRAIQRRGGMPLIDLALLEDRLFTAGMCATFCFFAGNLSFYFVLTLYLQNGLAFRSVRRGADRGANGVRIRGRLAPGHGGWRSAGWRR